jgi:hypothetical protein
MLASGDSAMEGAGDATAAASTPARDDSFGVEHDANRKPSNKAGRRRMDFSDGFMDRMIFIRSVND